MKPLTTHLYLLLVLTAAFLTAACQNPPAETAVPFPTFIEGRYAYAPASTGIKVIDINTPKHPKVIGEMATAGQLSRVQLHAGYLYAAKYQGWQGSTGEAVPSGIVIASLADATRPETINFLPFQHDIRTLLATDNYLFVSTWSETFIYDVTQPEQATLLKTIPNHHDTLAQAADGTIYGGWSHCPFRGGTCVGGINVITLNNNGQPPAQTTHEYDYIGIYGIIPFTNQLYIIGDTFTIGQRNDLANLPELLSPDLSIYGKPVAVFGDAFYTVSGHMIQSFDMSNHNSPHPITEIEISPVGTFFFASAQQDQTLFLVSQYGFHVLDITNPNNVHGTGYVALDG